MKRQARFCLPLLIFLAWTITASFDLNAQLDTPSGPVLRIVDVRKDTSAPACRPGAEELIDAAGQWTGCESWEGSGPDSRKIVELRSGARFPVEPLNATLVSAGGKTLLKYGNFANLVRPSRPVAWVLYSNTGKILTEQPGTLDPQAAVAMADDGHFAIVGRGAEAATGDASLLTLYTPSGGRVFSKSLGGVFATQVTLRSGARNIALAMTDSKRHRDGSTDIVLFAESGDRVGEIPGVRYPNALVFAGPSGDRLLVVSHRTLRLVDVATAKTLWSVNRSYRLAGPGCAGISPDGLYLYLITTELSGKPQDRQPWRAYAVSVATGAPLASIDLPGEHPSAKAPVIGRISDRTLTLTTPSRDIITIGVKSR